MYIVALKEGYIQIDGLGGIDGYTIVTHPDGPTIKMKIKRRKRTIGLIPIGQIAINCYNKNLESYLNSGGTVSECLRLHKSGRIKLKQPYPPFWIIPDNCDTNTDLTELDYSDDLTYLPVSFVDYNGVLVPVFSVSEVSDLFQYDCFRLIMEGIDIRECEDCGKAFFGKTSAVRCPNCRKEGRGEKKKRDNLKNDPVRNRINRIKDRIKKRSKAPEYQQNYVNPLLNLLDGTKDTLKGSELNKELQKLDELDLKYGKLHRRIISDSYTRVDPENEDYYSMFEQVDPEKWLRDWYIKVGLVY